MAKALIGVLHRLAAAFSRLGQSRARRSALFVIAVFAIGGSAVIADIGGGRPTPVFALSKSLCVGNPAAPEAINCPLASVVPANSPVYYVFRITNPIGQPQQQVTLTDPLPAGFQPTSQMTCRLPSGAAVAVQSSSAADALGTITLPVGETVICFLPGQFAAAGQYSNSVTGTNQFGSAISGDVNTAVLPTTPLGVDLSVTKSALTPALDISIAPGVMTYTITIANNGSGPADIGAYFQLHDTLSLLPDSVAFRAELVSASCIATSGSDCLDPAGPVSQGNVLVGTMGAKHLFSWGFANGQGVIADGGTLTLTIKVQVEQLVGLSCFKAPGADGIRNTAFFTLANNNAAFTEANPANNTGIADVKLTTGAVTQDAECGDGHLKVVKTQIKPGSGKVGWGQNVAYRITIKNQSLPQQPITIAAGDLQDWVQEGINTPPFTRNHIVTTCVSSTQSGLCGTLNGQFGPSPAYTYGFYGESNQAWKSAPGGAFTLQYGQEIVIDTAFRYEDPDCETVPAAANKPIHNTIMVDYQATEYGATSPNAPLQTFRQMASAKTLMEDQAPCQFKVTKKRIKDKKIKGDFIHFGTPFSYEVVFESNEPERKVGTVMDVLRIDRAGYTQGLAFQSNWKCSDNGRVSGYAPTGQVGGTVRYTATPLQGGAAVDFRAVSTDAITFDQGGKLSCIVTVIVQRPEDDDPYCLNDDVRLENLTLMDVTDPLNTNINWPPAGIYTPAALTNPSPQNRNWAMAGARMPRCIDAQVNKAASVDGLPGYSAAWTFQNGPPITYAVKVDNLGGSDLLSYGSGFSPFDGMVVTDTMDAPYQGQAGNIGQQSCTPANFCQQNSGSPNLLGIKNIPTAGSGVWSYSFPGNGTGSLQPGTMVGNCVTIDPTGDLDPAKGYFYTKRPAPLSKACTQVPVIPTTTITVTKTIADQTGAGITQGGPFTVEVRCAPYALFGTGGTFTIAAGGSHTVQNVPISSSCTVEEPQLPQVPAAATAACQQQDPFAVAEWGPPSVQPGTLAAPLGAGGNAVQLTNTLSCKAGQSGTIRVKKLIRNWEEKSGSVVVNLALECTPAANPANLTLQVSAAGSTGTTQAPVGAQCTITETLPAFPPAIIDYCDNVAPGVSMEPQWDPPIYMPGNSFTVQASMNDISVINKWTCKPKKPQGNGRLVVTKQFAGNKLFQSIARSFGVEVTADCSPAAAQPVLSLNIPGGQVSGMIAVSGNATCQITEALSPLPPPADAFCARQGMLMRARWATPVLSPAMPITIPPGATVNVTITNQIECYRSRPGKLVEDLGIPAVLGTSGTVTTPDPDDGTTLPVPLDRTLKPGISAEPKMLPRTQEGGDDEEVRTRKPEKEGERRVEPR